MTQIGQPARRIEDHRFLTGRGQYVDDIDLPGQTWAQVVRSPHAHALIKKVDIQRAAEETGVLGIFTAADLNELGHLPCTTHVATEAPMIVPPRPALATSRVRHVGDPVAFIVAETRDQAMAAAEAVEVDYEPLSAVVDARAALAPDAPQIWHEAPGNASFRFAKGNRAAVDAAFAAAKHVVELDLVNNRLIIVPLEPRAAIASNSGEELHLLVTAAGVHAIRDQLADTVFRIPRDRIRVSAPDVGGGFGVKNALYPEWAMLLWAAKRLGRPVKWIATRAEDFISTAQGRDNYSRGRLALSETGDFLALDVHTVANLGAYLSSGGPGSSTNAPAAAIGGGYAIPAISMNVTGAFTNTVPIDAYRGAGKPEANYLIERLIDHAARQCGFDATELRRRNLIRSFPYRKALGTTVDCGRFGENLETALDFADSAHAGSRKAAAVGNNRLRGIGIACFLETARGAPDEGAEIRFGTDGRVDLRVGTQSNGQGHETSYPQIAADLFGLPLGTFRYVQADTKEVTAGNGHGGARSMHMGGAALVKAAQAVLAKGKTIAAHLLQTKEDELEFRDGVFVAGSGTPRSIDLLSTARAARNARDLPEGVEANLDTYVWNQLDVITFPNGCHIAEVEVDIETGMVSLVRYTAVDDFGTLINPLLTAGQIHGGVAQGIGQALLERTVYNAHSGQLLSGSLLDYALPRAADLPNFAIQFCGIPTKANPLGVKGAGQAGAIAAPQTIISAILDALSPLGVRHIDMPATPERVWRAIQDARKS